ncbi:MAG: rhamnulokinase [Opitutales bacterium]|nr:rhamnulokinase [Opitutales bacterium]
MTNRYLAVDLGAESGRVMLGTLSDDRLDLKELHRFANVPLSNERSLTWDLDALFREIKLGLVKAGQLGLSIDGVSVDAWGVDYVLLDEGGEIMPPAYHYRDPRNKAAAEEILEQIPWEEIYEETGLQFIDFNTLFQLAAENPVRLQQASVILPIADTFNNWLSGVMKTEFSVASTTQLYDPRKRRWSPRLLDILGIPPSKLPEIVSSGTALGPLLPSIAEETGLNGVEVVAGLSHDTGAAVAAVPVAEDSGDWAFLSSGTWSLIGTELREPLINEHARSRNFTNEIGYGHRVRFLRNVIGLWLVQECRRRWAEQGMEYDYAELMKMANEATPFAHLVDPDDERFFHPENMPAEIAGYCRETNQDEPSTPGAFVRCVLESLALLYRHRIRDLSELTGRKFTRLHVIGGGSRNELLNQFTADALGMPVVAGPAEATALGNVAAQALACGKLSSLEDARRKIAESCDLRIHHPQDTNKWNSLAEKFAWPRAKT